jgi:hypothetical protein
MKIPFMKKSLPILFLFLCHFLSAQVLIKGTVSSNKVPLEGAAIYLNNSSIGTTSDSEGNFELTIKEGTYDLIVSYLGYKTINYTLITSKHKNPLHFNLVEDANRLDEIVIRKTVYDSAWKFNLEEFKSAFIGRSELAQECEILNPKVLHFEFDNQSRKLEAFAKEPLRIRHKRLGYMIIYDLVSFKIEKNIVTFLGYTQYKNLKGGKRKKRKWDQARVTVYNGSRIHFFKALAEKKLTEEGFIVNQFERKLNPKRPTEEQIKNARQLLRLSGSRYTRVNDTPKTAIDSALVILRKARLPKYADFLYKKNVPYKDMITIKGGKTYLTFENYLSIIYTKEKEELNYLKDIFSRTKRAPGPQTSSIVILQKYPYIEPSGMVIAPLDVFYEGYWGFEKLAETLPLDYEPFKD